jgi:hypothetical protein
MDLDDLETALDDLETVLDDLEIALMISRSLDLSKIFRSPAHQIARFL